MNKKIFNLTTPILFLVFNRPDTTKQVFEEIRKAKPKELFIAADGPRNAEEKKKTDEVKKIVSKIDWPCKVKTLFRDKNLGCKYAVSGAIDWFFENVECGVILEDDCLPSQSFFRFCQEMLIKYKEDEKIMHISGTNVEVISSLKESYFFSNTYNVWGWATWKRAWKKYDVEIKDWEGIRFSKKFFKITEGYNFITRIKSWRLYQLTYSKKINTWDYQWDLCLKENLGLSIIPKKNSITNLGFDDGTHTTNYCLSKKTLEKKEITFPLIHQGNKQVNFKYFKKYVLFFKRKVIDLINKKDYLR